MKILLVDDSKAMRNIVMRTLRQAGFDHCEIEEAINGVDALDKIKTSPPDVVLSDWNMPEMGGMDLLRTLKEKQMDYRFNFKFGFVTSEGSQEMRRQAADAGALFLIAKPFTAASFQTALEPILRPRYDEKKPDGTVQAVAPPPMEAPPAEDLPPSNVYKLCVITAIQRMVSELVGKTINAKKDTPMLFSALKSLAVYRLDGINTIGFLSCELPLGAAMAAALSMIPAAQVKEIVASGKLSETFAGNLYEVFNVASTLFDPERGPHWKLKEVINPGQTVPKEILTAMLKPKERLDMNLEVVGYGAGKMSLLVTY